ncbi:MAG: hypothetical protein M3P95_00110, partial [Actinomycetota bacterium]|nr:hypothetical protein [Actinomycetota bacterium]
PAAGGAATAGARDVERQAETTRRTSDRDDDGVSAQGGGDAAAPPPSMLSGRTAAAVPLLAGALTQLAAMRAAWTGASGQEKALVALGAAAVAGAGMGAFLLWRVRRETS